MTRRGFTLIELLVTVFITSIVSIAAYAMFFGTSNNFNDEKERQKVEANLRNAELLIQRDLSRVGYHTAFDSSSEGDNIAGFSGSTFQAFVSYRSASPTYSIFKNNNPVDQAFRVAQFSFAADFTDYDGFLVNTQSGTELTIGDTLQLPVTASALSNIETNTPSRTTASENTFKTALYKSFEHAIGIYAVSDNGKWGMMEIPQTERDKDSMVVQISNNTFDPKLGFIEGAPFQNKFIYPITSVTYKLQTDGNHNGFRDGEYNLVRCYNKAMPSAGAALNSIVKQETCQTLIRNILYFELYPIAVKDGSDGTNLNDILTFIKPNDSNPTVVGLVDTSEGNASYSMPSVHLGSLRGFYYRIGAVGSQQSKTTNRTNAAQPAFTAEGNPIVHIQGTAVIKTKNPLSVGEGSTLTGSI